MALVNAAK
jgi:magnesium-transporting ATPase (P-type)